MSFMLSVILLNAIILNVSLLNVIMLSVILLNAIMLCVILLKIGMLSVVVRINYMGFNNRVCGLHYKHVTIVIYHCNGRGLGPF
jgi:hypothetical protein